jgi:hypothetical protein
MTMGSRKNLSAVAVCVVLAVGVAGCSGGGAAAPVAAASSASPSLPAPSSSASDAGISMYLGNLRTEAALPNSGQLAVGKSSDSELMSTGAAVCSELRGHEVPKAVVQGLVRKGWTPAAAVSIVDAAAGFNASLCPDQFDVVNAWEKSIKPK